MAKAEPTFLLERAPNGGWVVSDRSDDYRMAGRILAAYSTDKAMLTGLADLIAEAREET